MNICLEYKLECINHYTAKTPDWISRGGFIGNPADKTFCGFSPSSKNRSWYVPNEVVQLSEEEFVQRGLLIHQTYPFTTLVGLGENKFQQMTTEEVTSMLRELYRKFIEMELA